MPTDGDLQLTAGHEPRDTSGKENPSALDLPCGRSGHPCTKQRLTKRPSGSVNQKTLLGFIVIYSFLYLFVVLSINLSIILVIDKQRSMTGPFMHNAMKNTQKERPWHNLRYWYNILSEKLRQIAKIPVIGQNF